MIEIGTIFIIASLVVPPHYAAAHGQCIDRAGREILVATLTDHGRPIYGTCSNPKQIRLPDLRGRALYGRDSNSPGIVLPEDSGRTVIIKIEEED
jgi:microcystin-dependent protein